MTVITKIIQSPPIHFHLFSIFYPRSSTQDNTNHLHESQYSQFSHIFTTVKKTQNLLILFIFFLILLPYLILIVCATEKKASFRLKSGICNPVKQVSFVRN